MIIGLLALLSLTPTPIAIVVSMPHAALRPPSSGPVRRVTKRLDSPSGEGLEHGRPGERLVHGFVVSANAQTIVLQTRSGRLNVDVSHAFTFVDPTPNRALVVVGQVSSDGVLHARRIHRFSPDSARWDPDE